VSDASRLEVGRIGRAHGLRGEVAVTLHSDRPERTATGATLVAVGPSGEERELVVASARRHQGRWLIRFEGVADRTEGEALRGCLLMGEALPGDGDELWVHDLIGSTVLDRAGARLGEVAAVEANPAHDLLVLDGGALIPLTFVVEHGPGRLVVEIPEGLLDL
jgi:16S rRNA processing protein RimM